MEPNERKLRKNSYDAVGCDVAWALPLLSSMPLVDLTLGIDLTFGSVRDAAGTGSVFALQSSAGRETARSQYQSPVGSL